MSNLYRDYIWKNGIPYGLGAALESIDGVAYKIAMDPYRKRIAVEIWASGLFQQVIYDSALLDFRHLHPSEQTAWEKVIIKESDLEVISEIRNQDDRTILSERYRFEKGFCRSCQIFSSHGFLVAQQKLYYQALEDAFNGAILYDSAQHVVMFKKYACDEISGEFTQLLEEQWDAHKAVNLCHAV